MSGTGFSKYLLRSAQAIFDLGKFGKNSPKKVPTNRREIIWHRKTSRLLDRTKVAKPAPLRLSGSEAHS
jgi:hypothetical protein